jgi:hypothetical protein
MLQSFSNFRVALKLILTSFKVYLGWSAWAEFEGAEDVAVPEIDDAACMHRNIAPTPSMVPVHASVSMLGRQLWWRGAGCQESRQSGADHGCAH